MKIKRSSVNGLYKGYIKHGSYLLYIYITVGVLLFLFAILMLYGIKKNGRVILISGLLKNKDLNNELLTNRYTIQSYYTMLFGAILVFLTLSEVTSRLNILIFVMLVGIFDGLFDFFAIKKALKS